jgi:hypothetical protein
MAAAIDLSAEKLGAHIASVPVADCNCMHRFQKCDPLAASSSLRACPAQIFLNEIENNKSVEVAFVQGSGGACRLFCPTKKLSAPFAEIRWVGNARTGIDMRAKTHP